MNENIKTAGQFHPCAPGQVVHTRGPVDDAGKMIQLDSYYPLVGWWVTLDADNLPAFEPVFVDDGLYGHAMTLTAWKASPEVSPYEQFVAVEPAPQPAGMLTI